MNADPTLSGKSRDYAERSIVVLEEETSVADAAKQMRNNGVMSVLVSRAGSCVGIVTEKDLLYRVVAENRGPFKTVLKNVMSTPLITIDAEAPLQDAIMLMRAKFVRRLPVTSGDKVIGLLTLRSIVGNSVNQSVELAELEIPHAGTSPDIVCPYCNSKFSSKEEMSKHIDRLHLGAGLLEGDLRQW